MSEFHADVAIPDAPDSSAKGEWLIRIEGAIGVDLSPLTECRLWTFPAVTLPEQGKLRLRAGFGPDTPNTVWVIGGWPPHTTAQLQVNVNLGSNEWYSVPFDVALPLGSAIAVPLNTGNLSEPHFFRLRY